MRASLQKKHSFFAYFLAFILACCFMFSFGSVDANAASTIAPMAASVYSQTEQEIEQHLVAFLTMYLSADMQQSEADRSQRTTQQQQSETAIFLQRYLTKLSHDENKAQARLLTLTYENLKYYNVEATIVSKTPNAKQVLLGAHYDNAGSLGNQGIYDNGLSVATLIALYNNLQFSNLPFDLVFVFFAIEETGLNGSMHYANNNLDIDRALVYINLDSVGVGDNLYVYTHEKITQHENYLLSRARGRNISLTSMPDNKKIMASQPFVPNLSYTHIGMYSDHTSFSNAGLLIINFFSYNLEVGSFILRESANKPNIMHTENDNLTYIRENYPGYLRHTAYVYTLLLDIFKDYGLTAMLVSSKQNLPDLSPYYQNAHMFTYIIAAVGFLLILYVIFMQLRVQSRKALPAYPTKKVRLSQFIPINIREQLEKEINFDSSQFADDGKIYVFGSDYEGSIEEK